MAPLRVYVPQDNALPPPAAGRPAIIYLRNLARPRLGRESDASIIRGFLRDGFVVATIDFGRDPRAVAPQINFDLWLMRRLVDRLFSVEKIDQDHLYTVPEGCRLARDVTFYTKGDETFRFDLVYPSRPERPVPVLLHISIDNASRMSNAAAHWTYHDMLSECAATRGYAVAWIDNPSKAFFGFEPMPATAYRLKAAVRTVRALAPCYGLDARRVAVEGFSRSAGAAALLAMTGGLNKLEGDGPHREQSSRVQCAILHAGRMDHLALLKSGHALGKNYQQVWGDPAKNAAAWEAHSAISYVTPDDPPTFLSTGSDDDFRTEQMQLMDAALERAKVPHQLLVTPRMQHWVVEKPEAEGQIYEFLDAHLAPAPEPVGRTRRRGRRMLFSR
jgi:acetyl esterase/lipase